MKLEPKKIRDLLRVIGACCFSWLYVPHILIYTLNSKVRHLINSDLDVLCGQTTIHLPRTLAFLHQLHNNRYYRKLFYHRIGPAWSLLIGWYRSGDSSFLISPTTRIGRGFWLAHPYSTVLNAESIGDNFRCLHCTTIGSRKSGRPTIGNNVSIGCHACVLGKISIGNNVKIGAGSVIVKDIPDNCVVVGNPAKIVKQLTSDK